MSLVTRCTACATLFRVAQDQLRASDGWVRCGRCDTVFDALESLESLQDEQQSAPAHLVRSAPEKGADDGQADAEPIDVEALLKRRVEAQIVKPTAGLEIPAAADAPVCAVTPVEATAAPGPAPDPTTGSPQPAVPPRPEFVRRAERDARWQRPAMRLALTGTSIILLLMLGAQVAYHHRDQLAARSPLAADLLATACTRWNCAIQAPRLLDAVVVEHSALSRVPERPGVLQLSVRIVNRNDSSVALPAVELTLTDASGQPIARRALLPADFGAAAQIAIAARTERTLQLLFTTGEHIVSGFSVELFHP